MPTRNWLQWFLAKTLSSLASLNWNTVGYLKLFTWYEQERLLLFLGSSATKLFFAVRLWDIKIPLTKKDLHPCIEASLHWQWAFFYNTVCERTTSPPTRNRHFCLWAKTLSSLASSNRNMFGYLGLFTRYERDKLLLMLRIYSRSGHWHIFFSW